MSLVVSALRFLPPPPPRDVALRIAHPQALQSADAPIDISHIPTTVFKVIQKHKEASHLTLPKVEWDRLPARLTDALFPFQRQGLRVIK